MGKMGGEFAPNTPQSGANASAPSPAPGPQAPLNPMQQAYADAPMHYLAGDFGGAITEIARASEQMAAAASGPSGQFKLDPDAMQGVINTWNQVLDELAQCTKKGQALAQVVGPTDHDPDSAVGKHFSDSGQKYLDHIQELTDRARSERDKLRKALDAYRQTDGGGAHAARNVQGHL